MENFVNHLLKRSKSAFLFLLVIFCLSATGCNQQLYQYSAPVEAKNYPVLNYKLIKLIDAFKKNVPTTLETSQAFFYNKLHIRNETEYASFYSAGPFITRDGVVIQKVEIIAKKDSKTPVINLDLILDQKQCVSTELFKRKFNADKLFVQTFHLKDPPMGYFGRFDWGSFSVGTTLYNKNCATDVGVGALEN